MSLRYTILSNLKISDLMIIWLMCNTCVGRTEQLTHVKKWITPPGTIKLVAFCIRRSSRCQTCSIIACDCGCTLFVKYKYRSECHFDIKLWYSPNLEIDHTWYLHDFQYIFHSYMVIFFFQKRLKLKSRFLTASSLSMCLCHHSINMAYRIRWTFR